MVINLGLQTREGIPESKTSRVYCDHPPWPSANSLEKLLLQQPYSSHGSWSLPLQRPSLFETSSNEELAQPLAYHPPAVNLDVSSDHASPAEIKWAGEMAGGPFVHRPPSTPPHHAIVVDGVARK
ncbi:uncharacterized protein M6G45_016743 [Spheniscus humboldti]